MRSLTAMIHQWMVEGEIKMMIYRPENLEKLLENLFADDDELELDDIVVFGRPVPFTLSPECCGRSYTSYGG